MISAAVETQGERFSKSAGGPTSLVDLPECCAAGRRVITPIERKSCSSLPNLPTW